ncbi:IS66 family transposase [Candidatus Dependentiae bacterium]|nr:IS66 family transposase [Candidatus Dependentiae bacterium]
MKIENIDVNEVIRNAQASIKNDRNISSTTRTVFELLIMLISILLNRLNLNSSNSSKPPSTDKIKKKKKQKKTNKNPGGQKGHQGSTLEPVNDPDQIHDIAIDKRTLPKGKKYTIDGYEARQVINMKISSYVIEYRAQVLVDEQGKKYVAAFPDGVIRPIQYGASVKANAVYSSVYQLIPYERVQEQFRDEYGIPLSKGSIYNFNNEASNLLVSLGFEQVAKKALQQASVAHADETGINLNGSKIWLHNLSNEQWTWFAPHEKRGSEAMDDIGIIPSFTGVLCHDHWKSYYTYDCTHSLCNAHHLRELTRTYEQDKQEWANQMHIFLTALNKEVDDSRKTKLSKKTIKQRREAYRLILDVGEQECPLVKPPPGTKRKPAQSKARNLLTRLRKYEDDVLLFMINPLVPFTNNQGERDIRMTKVQQKISGCFRSMDGAINFCRVRSYLSTCKKNGVAASDALEMLFNKTLPKFIQ